MPSGRFSQISEHRFARFLVKIASLKQRGEGHPTASRSCLLSPLVLNPCTKIRKKKETSMKKRVFLQKRQPNTHIESPQKGIQEMEKCIKTTMCLLFQKEIINFAH